MRYYFGSTEMKVAPAGLKTALEKLKTVEKVEINENEHTITVAYTKECDKVAELEAVAINSGIPALILNHCHVLIGLSPIKGQTADFNKARAELAAVEGVSGIDIAGGFLELHCDLQKLSKESVDEAAKRAGYTTTVNQSYELVTYKVTEGDYNDYLKEISAKRGVMLVTELGDNTVSAWVKKGMINIKKDLEAVNGIKVEKLKS